MHLLDLTIQSYVTNIRTGQLTELMYLVSALFDVTILSVVVTLCVAWFVYLIRGIRYSILFLASVTTTSVLVLVLKNMFNISRPTDGVLSVFGQSFPSYHATIATVFFVMLMYIFDDYFSKFSRIAFNAFCIVSLFVVAFSRVYLGVHWTSDVLGGIALGAIISYGAVIVSKKIKK